MTETKGADDLKMASRHLNLIQYFCLDVVLFIYFILYLIWKLAKMMWASDGPPAQGAATGEDEE